MKPFPFSKKQWCGTKADDGSGRRSILVMLGKCFVEQKQYQQAAEMMEAAIRLSGEDQANELLYEISKLYLAAGQTDKAIQSLNKIKGNRSTLSGPQWRSNRSIQLI